MRILVVANEPPYPGHAGGPLRVRHLLERVARRHEVIVAAHVRSADEAHAATAWRRAGIRLETDPLSRPRSAATALGALREAIRGRPPELGLYRSMPLARRIGEILRTEKIDVLQIEESILAPYLRVLPRPSATRSVLVFHDLRSLQLRGIAPLERRPALALWRRWNAALMRRFEARAAGAFDRCVTVSSTDGDRLRALAPGAAVEVVENGVDTGRLRPLPPAPNEHRTILFVGNLGYLPCEAAAVELARDTMPRLRRAGVRAALEIVGRAPGRRVRDLAADDVRIVGDVDDLEPYYARAAVAVAPIRAASGTRLKILEAMAYGRPVVSTALGAEGLRVRGDEHLRITEGAEGFADAIRTLLENPTEATALAARARSLVERDYDWERIADRQLEIYEALGDPVPSSSATIDARRRESGSGP